MAIIPLELLEVFDYYTKLFPKADPASLLGVLQLVYQLLLLSGLTGAMCRALERIVACIRERRLTKLADFHAVVKEFIKDVLVTRNYLWNKQLTKAMQWVLFFVVAGGSGSSVQSKMQATISTLVLKFVDTMCKEHVGKSLDEVANEFWQVIVDALTAAWSCIASHANDFCASAADVVAALRRALLSFAAHAHAA